MLTRVVKREGRSRSRSQRREGHRTPSSPPSETAEGAGEELYTPQWELDYTVAGSDQHGYLLPPFWDDRLGAGCQHPEYQTWNQWPGKMEVIESGGFAGACAGCGTMAGEHRSRRRLCHCCQWQRCAVPDVRGVHGPGQEGNEGKRPSLHSREATGSPSPRGRRLATVPESAGRARP